MLGLAPRGAALGSAAPVLPSLLHLARQFTEWATVDPKKLSGAAPASCQNLGKLRKTRAMKPDGEP